MDLPEVCPGGQGEPCLYFQDSELSKCLKKVKLHSRAKNHATHSRLSLRKVLRKKLKSIDQKSSEQLQDVEDVAWQLCMLKKENNATYWF